MCPVQCGYENLAMKRWTHKKTPILAGFSTRKSYFREAVVQHQEHEINVALSGEGVYRLGKSERLTLAAGEILLLPGGVRHGIEVPRSLHMAVLHVHPDALAWIDPNAAPAKWMARLRNWEDPLPARKMVVPDALASLEHLTEEAVVEQNRRNPAREALLRALAIQAGVHFLRLMMAEIPPGAADETARRVLTVRSWMDRHFGEARGLAGLAAMAHLAPTYFAAQFRRIVGIPPMTYLRQRRLEQARLLLEQTDQSVKEIAWSVGFNQVDHFHHAFRQALGRTPLEYRMQSHSARHR
jgi:AraC-like DNA-binding protein